MAQPRGRLVSWRHPYTEAMNFGAIEAFYLTLLILVGIVITWFAGFVVYKLYKGQK